MSTSSTTSSSWESVQNLALQTPTGQALTLDETVRSAGGGGPHVRNKLRLFDSSSSAASPKLTLFRDHAGWCPYCEKTILLVEEKRIPIHISTVPMRSYGDKPREFLSKVPNGLLPALAVEMEDGSSKTITESQVIMELLDQWHTEEDGYRPMLPKLKEDMDRYQMLARLERELFSWWCTFMFRPETPPSSGAIKNVFGLFGNSNSESSTMSDSMRGFVDCISKVDTELGRTDGPWFLSYADHPTMIDFIFVSHIERMLASCAFWKGFNIRDNEQFPNINAWFDAFDERESYLAFKSDYYTNVMDIPPQYGPPYIGGNDPEKQKEYANALLGRDGTSWTLPLDHDDALQPLYRGPPLPLCVLEATDLMNYRDADPKHMAIACRHMAGWKLASGGKNISNFAARGGSQGATNARKTFAAQLADPYAKTDETVVPMVESVLQIVCRALLETESSSNSDSTHEDVLSHTYESEIVQILTSDKDKREDIVSSLAYLRDRVGVPRDLPLAAARHLRAHLNWAIDIVDAA